MIEMKITEGEIKLAEELARKIVKFDTNATPYFGGGVAKDMIGKVGEIKFMQFLDGNSIKYSEQITPRDSYFAGSSDFVIDGEIIDVKTRRYDKGKPTENWGLNFPSQQMNKNADFYVFYLINLNERKSILVGYLPKTEFIKRAVFRPKGEEVTEFFTVSNDMYEIKVSDVFPIEQFLKHHQRMGN